MQLERGKISPRVSTSWDLDHRRTVPLSLHPMIQTSGPQRVSDPALSDSQTAPGADIHVVAAASYNVRIVHEDVVVVIVFVFVGVAQAWACRGGVWDDLFVFVGGRILDEHVQVVLEVVELVVVGFGVKLAQGRVRV